MNKRKILVIDDEPTIRAALSRLLEKEGYEVHLSADGSDASGKLLEIQPELIVLDLNMAEMSGFLVLSFIRDTPHLAATKIIVLSGLDTEAIERASGMGAHAVFKKPADNNELVQCVHDLLQINE